MNTVEIRIHLLFIFLLAFLMPNMVLAQETVAKKKKPRVGLVLSGGGARGFAHIGVLKVLEEEGIKIDVIGGTSMGSIVGGFYAMGYSVKEIERIAREMDWNYQLNDKINRRNLGMFEKYDNEAHIFSVAFENKKVSIPPGLVYGQNVINVLTKITDPVFQTKDFKDLNIPFFCIATDLLSGKAIVLDTGNLAVAIRASMSVPTAFVPIKYGPYYLVDGGLVNNLPSKEVRDLGADVLIGVDIQTPIYKKEEITNLVEVLSQSIFLNAEAEYNRNLDELDFLIKPDIDPYTSMSFDQVDSLIARGERKARELLPQLRAFMDSVGIVPQDVARDYNAFPDMDMLYIDDIIIKGNKKISRKFLMKNLDIYPGDQVHITALYEKINLLYGTKLFHTIYYSIQKSDEGKTVLVIEVDEASLFDINVGAHYNDYVKAGLLLNLTGRNFGVPNGRLSVDFTLGKVNRFTARYIVDNGLKLGFGGDVNFFNQYGFVYDEYGNKEISFGMTILDHQGFGLLTFKNIMSLRLGYELESNTIKQDISVLNFDKMENVSGALFMDFSIDTYDRLYLPHKGYGFYAKAMYGTGQNTDIVRDTNDQIIYPKEDFTYWSFDVYGKWVIPVLNHFVILPEVYFRKNFGNGIPMTKTAAFGGFSQSYIPSFRPFPGYDFMSLSGHTAFYPALTLRQQFWNDHFLSFKGRFLSLNLVLDQSLQENDFYYGWQFTYTYYSMLGPINFSVAEAYPIKEIVFDFSLGFWF